MLHKKLEGKLCPIMNYGNMYVCLLVERILCFFFFFLNIHSLFKIQHTVQQFYQILFVMCSHKTLKA